MPTALYPPCRPIFIQKEKHEAEKKKYKQNMERMTKIVGDYKSELDKARKELKDAKGKK